MMRVVSLLLLCSVTTSCRCTPTTPESTRTSSAATPVSTETPAPWPRAVAGCAATRANGLLRLKLAALVDRLCGQDGLVPALASGLRPLPGADDDLETSHRTTDSGRETSTTVYAVVVTAPVRALTETLKARLQDGTGAARVIPGLTAYRVRGAETPAERPDSRRLDVEIETAPTAVPMTFAQRLRIEIEVLDETTTLVSAFTTEAQRGELDTRLLVLMTEGPKGSVLAVTQSVETRPVGPSAVAHALAEAYFAETRRLLVGLGER